MSAHEANLLIERFLAALNARDIAGSLACLHEEAVFDLPDGHRVIGPDAFQRYLVSRFQDAREQYMAATILTDEHGLRAAVECVLDTQNIDGSGSVGSRVSRPAGLFFEIDDDHLSRVTIYHQQ